MEFQMSWQYQLLTIGLSPLQCEMAFGANCMMCVHPFHRPDHVSDLPEDSNMYHISLPQLLWQKIGRYPKDDKRLQHFFQPCLQHNL